MLTIARAGGIPELRTGDLHWGQHEKRNRMYTPDQKALGVIRLVEWGIQHGVQRMIVGGDSHDDRVPRRKADAEAMKVRSAWERAEGNMDLLIERGNHDDDIHKRLRGLFGPHAIFQDGYINHWADSGVSDGHGDVFDIEQDIWDEVGMTAKLEQAKAGEKAADTLLGHFMNKDKKIKKRLDEIRDTDKQIEYFEEKLHTLGAGFVCDWIEKGLWFFRRAREEIASSLRRLRVVGKRAQETREKLAKVFDLRSLALGAYIANEQDSWAFFSGHSHLDGLHLRQVLDKRTALPKHIIVGNWGGGFVQKGEGIHAIYSNYPHAKLLEYFPVIDRVEVVQELSLPEAERTASVPEQDIRRRLAL